MLHKSIHEIMALWQIQTEKRLVSEDLGYRAGQEKGIPLPLGTVFPCEVIKNIPKLDSSDDDCKICECSKMANLTRVNFMIPELYLNKTSLKGHKYKWQMRMFSVAVDWKFEVEHP